MIDILIAAIAALLSIAAGIGYLLRPNSVNPSWLLLLFGIAAAAMSIGKLYFWLEERGLLKNWKESRHLKE